MEDQRHTQEPDIAEVALANQAGGVEWQLADGRTVHAESLPDAREKCPVLGKMSLEEAGVLYDLASIGQAKMAEEKVSQAAERREPTSFVHKDKPSPKTSKPEVTEKQTPKSLESPAPSVEENEVLAGAERLAEELVRQQGIKEVLEEVESVPDLPPVKAEAPAENQSKPPHADAIIEKPADDHVEPINPAEPEEFLAEVGQREEPAPLPAVEVAEGRRQENLIQEVVHDVERAKPAEVPDFPLPQPELIETSPKVVEADIQRINMAAPSRSEEINLRGHIKADTVPEQDPEVEVDNFETNIETGIAPEPLDLSLPAPENFIVYTPKDESAATEEPEFSLAEEAPETIVADLEPVTKLEETPLVTTSITEQTYVETAELQQNEEAEEAVEFAEEPQFEPAEVSNESQDTVSPEAVEVFKALSELQAEDQPELSQTDTAEIDAQVPEVQTLEPTAETEIIESFAAEFTGPETVEQETLDSSLDSSSESEVAETKSMISEIEPGETEAATDHPTESPDVQAKPAGKIENNFEAFVESVRESEKAEEPPELSKIQTESEGQPAEQVLAELAEYLEQTDPEPAAEPLRQFLEEVAQTWPKAETAGEKPKLTPELTDKLLELLRQAGYKQPDKALLEMARSHGIEFLLDALRYLSLLANQAERKEFVNLAAAQPFGQSNTIGNRLGKLMVRFISALEPSLAVAD